jgi:geranylgeranyl diphosphate synthase type II
VAFDLEHDLNERRGPIDAALASWMAEDKQTPSPLREAMAYSLLAPGKRLRPILATLACEASGGTAKQALPAACALEMVHTYSLIHDDLPAMDDDDLRRGRPTCHKQFGEALAILAGDALLTLAFEIVAASYPPAIASVSVVELARGAGRAGMVGGQTLDLLGEGRIPGSLPRSVDALETIHQRKTGALFLASIRLGFFTAGRSLENTADRALCERLDTFARAFGLMFQVHDDLLDVRGDSAVAGKRVGKDAARGKLTYPGLLGVEESRRKAEQLWRVAREALEPLGPLAEPLERLTAGVMERDR